MLQGRSGPVRREITEEEFHQLYPKLVAVFRQKGVPLDEARELAQETFLQACKSLGSFRERSTLDTWVISIAKRVWLKSLRARLTQKRGATEVSLDAVGASPDETLGSATFEETVLSRDLLERVGQAIQQLPDGMRSALLLYARGVKYREIAVRLGISENRVASLIHQARRKLRREFP